MKSDQNREQVRLILLLCLIIGLGGVSLGFGFLLGGFGTTNGSGTMKHFGRKKQDTLVVSKKGAPHATPLTGFNQNWLALPVNDERFLDTLRTFEPDLIRYPGGGVSDYWNWEKGGLNLKELPVDKEAWRQVFEHRPKGLEELKSVLEGLSADPVFVLNALTSTLNEQRAMLNTAAEKGIEVKYLEMGNEYFFDEKAHLQRFPSAEGYAKQMTQWANMLKRNFPGVKISAVGGFADRGHSARRQDWNSEVREYFLNRDAISFHPYMLINKKVNTYEEEIDFYTRLPWISQRRSHNMGFGDFSSSEQIWITEYNTLGKSRYRPNLRGTWMHGLLIVSKSLLLMQDQQVKMILPHQITGQEALYRAIETPRWGGSYGVTTYGKAIRYLFRIMNDHSTVQSLTIERKGTSNGGIDGDTDLIGNLFGSSTAVFVNMGSSKVVAPPNSFLNGNKFLYEKITASSPLSKDLGKGGISKERGRVSKEVVISPFSIVKISKK